MRCRSSALLFVFAFAACATRSIRLTPVPAGAEGDLVSVWCTPDHRVYALDADGGVHPLRGHGARLRWDQGGPIAHHGDRVYQVADGLLRVSGDGGESWTPVTTPAPTDMSYGHARLLQVATAGSSSALFALGRYLVVSNSLESDYAYLLRSDDDGASWSRVWIGPDQGPIGIGTRRGPDVSAALVVLSNRVAMAAAGDGSVLVSSDGGRTFARRTTPARRPLADLWVSPGGVLYGVGDDGEVVVSSDRGRTFQAVSSGVDEDLTDVTGCDEELWIVGERGTVLRY